MVEKRIFIMVLVFMIFASLSVSADYCFQESANVTNQSGMDGDCSLLYTGSYNWTGGWFDVEEAFDGNYATDASSAGWDNNAYLYINYTKPVTAKSAIWMLDLPFIDKVNLTIPDVCYDKYSEKVSLWMVLYNGFSDKGYYYCDGTNGTNLLYTFTESEIWEEGIYWYVEEILSFDNISNVPTRVNSTGDMSWYAQYLNENGATASEVLMKHFVNGLNVYNETKSDVVNGSTISSILSSGNYTNGDTLKIEINATDVEGNVSGVFDQSTIVNRLPVFTQSNFTVTTSHKNNISVQINSTDPDGDSLTWVINSSVFTINASGNINKTNSLSTVGSYNITVNATDEYDETSSMWVYFDITNTASNVTSVIISPAGANSSENLNVTYTSSDIDDDVVVAESYIWYVNGILNASYNNLTDVDSDNTTEGDEWVASVSVYDGLVWSDYKNSSTMVIGDDGLPTLSGEEISAQTGSNDNPFTLYVNATDENSIDVVTVEITDPNGIKTNFSMGILTGSRYYKTYTPSTDGIYTFKFYARDGSGNIADLTPTFTYQESTIGGETGSTGGGNPTVDLEDTKEECLIEIKPDTISFTEQKLLWEIEIHNNDDLTYTPVLNFENIEGDVIKHLDVTNIIYTVNPGKVTSFGIEYIIGSKFDIGEAKVTFTSDNCKTKELSIFATIDENAVDVFTDLFSGELGFVGFFAEPVFSPGSELRSKTKLFNVGISALIIFLVWFALIFAQVRKTVIDKNYILTMVWFIFIAGLTFITTIALISGLRGLQGVFI